MTIMKENILYIVCILFFLSLLLLSTLIRRKKRRQIANKPDTLEFEGVYQKRRLFSANEQAAFYKLQEIAEQYGLILFVKVRLLDLLVVYVILIIGYKCLSLILASSVVKCQSTALTALFR